MSLAPADAVDRTGCYRATMTMASCPGCNLEMGPSQTVCRGCGYDLLAPAKKGFAYSRLATFSLRMATLAAGVGFIGATLLCAGLVYSGRWLEAFAAGPIGATVAFANMIVFARVRDMAS